MKDKRECIYVIGCDENGIVKIGRTRDLKVRLGAIQRMSPVRVRVLWHTVGDPAMEPMLHKVFRARRIYGEWFDFTGLDPVAAVQAAIDGAWQEEKPCDSACEGSRAREDQADVSVVEPDCGGRLAPQAVDLDDPTRPVGLADSVRSVAFHVPATGPGYPCGSPDPSQCGGGCVSRGTVFPYGTLDRIWAETASGRASEVGGVPDRAWPF